MNGIDPYCKILSLKIGDSRVDGMETTYGLARAFEWIEHYNCKLANYSYGEPVAYHKGLVMDRLSELVNKKGLIFITSAGNSGPIISTIGAPGSILDDLIRVGAYTDTKLLELYNIPQINSFEGVYHWSSRGPTITGSIGVDLIAPGCALTSHPNWYKCDLKMCNGTSMASPNVAGLCSLILSNY